MGTYQLSDKDRLLIDRADGNIERLLGLINEILDYERSAKAGKLPLTYGSVIVSEIIGEAVDSLASQAAVKNVTLSTLATQATVCADEGKLGRVIVNLISNGIKYSPAQTTIQIRAELLNDFLEFSVTDQGPGVPDEYKQIIFDRYERLPDAVEQEGTGLGLSICKAIIESHSGLIGVKNAPQGGSIFWFTIPIDTPRA